MEITPENDYNVSNLIEDRKKVDLTLDIVDGGDEEKAPYIIIGVDGL